MKKKEIPGRVMACVVSYHPKAGALMDTARRAGEAGLHLVVVDNHSVNVGEVGRVRGMGHVCLVKNSRNYGVARALNQAMGYAQEHGYGWVLLLDQDSDFPFEKIGGMAKYCTAGVGIVAACAYDTNGGHYISPPCKKGVQGVQKCITSGSLASVKAWEEAGGFDSRLFIDGVDFDFCRRLRMHGYRILQDNHVVMGHELGSYRCKKVLFWNIKYCWHPSIRTYYITRNLVYLYRKYRSRHRCQGIAITALRVFKQFCIILFLMDRKWERFRLFGRALKDGCFMEVDKTGVCSRQVRRKFWRIGVPGKGAAGARHWHGAGSSRGSF